MASQNLQLMKCQILITIIIFSKFKVHKLFILMREKQKDGRGKIVILHLSSSLVSISIISFLLDSARFWQYFSEVDDRNKAAWLFPNSNGKLHKGMCLRKFRVLKESILFYRHFEYFILNMSPFVFTPSHKIIITKSKELKRSSLTSSIIPLSLKGI